MEETREKGVVLEQSIRAKLEAARERKVEEKKKKVSEKNASYYAKNSPQAAKKAQTKKTDVAKKGAAAKSSARADVDIMDANSTISQRLYENCLQEKQKSTSARTKKHQNKRIQERFQKIHARECKEA